MCRTIEEHYVKKIEAGIRGIKLGTKKVSDVDTVVNINLKNLLKYNPSLFEELDNNYKSVIKNFGGNG